MTIELVFSNRIECLAESLSNNLSAELFEKKNKFEPSMVIVPNQNMIKWLQLTLSALQGISLQIRFDFIENGLWLLLSELNQYRISARLMDYKTRTLRLVQCLNGMDLTRQHALGPVAGYLLTPEGTRKVDFAPRLWQLSRRLSSLFQEYEYHRPEMIAAWQAGKPAEDSMERCQQFLYQKIYLQATEENISSESSYLSLLEYAAKVLSRKSGFGKVSPRKIHIFGMSQISGLHLQLIERMAEFHSIFIYTLNPSREFWEDIQTPGEQRWLSKKRIASGTTIKPADTAGTISAVHVHPLLSAWGKPGRENVRQLCALTDYNFNDGFKKPEDQQTLLHRIQSDLLTLKSADDQAAFQDTSLQMFACPSRFREVETVYNTICHNLRQDGKLKLTDVAILVPDMELYKPIFDAVFNRDPRVLNYNLVDSNAQSESLYGQAVIQILQLAQGRFTRKEVFELLLNPSLMQRWNIGVEEVQDWVNWADELNIFHGFSRTDPSAKESVLTERFSWKQALQRLRIGRIMAPGEPGNSRKRDFGDVVPFTNLAASNLDVLEKFCVVVETLYSHVRRLSKFRGSRRQWARLFASVCDNLLQVPENNRGEAAVQHTLFQALEELKSIETPDSDQDANRDKDQWDIELFLEYVRFVLNGISGGRGDYLTGGVTISALFPMRPIPFKIIFIIGMEEGQFPGRDVPSALDLRQNDHRREDVSLAERNCYLFLEMLLCARRKLYLGYVARDIQKDRDIQPCSVINQLRHYIESTLLGNGYGFKIEQIPLKGNDPRYLDPNRITAWSDVMENFFLADRVSLFRSRNHWAEFIEHASQTDMDRIQPLTPILNTSKRPDKGTDTRRMLVTTRQLARFLIDPVTQSATSHLGLYGPEASIEDLAMKEDEPFYSVFPLDYTIQMACLRLWIDLNFTPGAALSPGEREPGFILEQLYTDYEKQSAAPEGVYGRLDRRAMLEKIVVTIDAMAELIAEAQTCARQYRAVHIGMAEDLRGDLFTAGTGVSYPPLEVMSSSVGPHGGQQQLLAEIHAALDWVWQDAGDQWHMLVLTGSKKSSSKPDRYLLAPLLAYLACMGKNPSELKMEGFPIHFHLVYESRVQSFKCQLAPDQAVVQLKNLLEAYGNQKDFHWLPFETVLKCKNYPQQHPSASVNDIQRLQFADEMATYFEEVDDYLIRRLAMPIAPELLDIAQKRFGWIFDVVTKA